MNVLWEMKKLGDVCKFVGGSQPPKALFSYEKKKGYVRLIQIRDYKSDKHLVYIKEDSTKKFCNETDVMIGRYGPPLFQILQGLSGAYNVALMKAIPNEELVSKDFIFLFLQTKKVQDYIISLSERAAGQTGVNKKALDDYTISFPEKKEQKQIVAILDQAFEKIEQARATAEKNLQNARELFESYLHSVFTQKGDGWEKKTLADIAIDFGRGKSKHRPRNDERLYGGCYPFIQTSEVRNCDHIIMNYSKTYNEYGLDQSKLWPKGTLCITIAANIAETGILDFDACFPDSVIGVVVDKKQISMKFLEYLLQSFKSVLQAKGKGSAQDNINLGTFENQLFPFPDLSIQEGIVIRLSSLSSEVKQLETIYQQKLNCLEELKKSILQKAFSGELTQGKAA